MRYTKDFNVRAVKQMAGVRYFVWAWPGLDDVGRTDGYPTEAEAKATARRLQKAKDRFPDGNDRAKAYREST